MSARSSSSVACSAAVRTIRPCSAGLTRSRIARSRLRTSSGSRLEMPYVLEFGIRTTNRPGSDTSCVRRAPLAPIGFLVTWQMMSWRARRMSSMRASVGLLLDVLGVVLDVAPVQHGVLRRGDVDERGLHAGQHVLDAPDVDVAVDEADVVGRAAHVVLDQVAALEHTDLGHARTHLHAHEEAPDRLAVALAATPVLDQLGVELERRLLVRAPRRRFFCGSCGRRSGWATTSFDGRFRRRDALRFDVPAPGAFRAVAAVRGGWSRAGVADLRLADQRLVGRLDRHHATLADRLRQLVGTGVDRGTGFIASGHVARRETASLLDDDSTRSPSSPSRPSASSKSPPSSPSLSPSVSPDAPGPVPLRRR